jgi:alkaline phosphatase
VRSNGVQRMRRAAALALIFWLAVAPAGLAAQVPTYIFLFLGDGMGIAQREVAELQLNDAPGQTAWSQDKRLAMNALAVTGVNTTHDAAGMVPDSASAATALSSGYKTLNGVIGFREDRRTPTAYITEALKAQGKSVGIISDVKIVHATPAAFYAHIDSRDKYDAIADQLVASPFDLFVGGGGHKHFAASLRKDGRDLYAEAESKGFRVVRSGEEFLALKPGRRVLANLPGDVFDEALPYVKDRRPGDPGLERIVAKSIELLAANPKGFFILVEGGQVDWACHANDTGALIDNLLELDRAVAVAVDFQKKHPETLIVVTGDHECGGLGLGRGKDNRADTAVSGRQAMSHETADQCVAAILAATGEDALPHLYALAAALGLPDLSAAEKGEIEAALRREAVPLDKAPSVALYGGYPPVSMTFRRLRDKRTSLDWACHAHTGVPVMLSAQGPGAERFAGYIDNTEVCKAMNAVTLAGMTW